MLGQRLECLREAVGRLAALIPAEVGTRFGIRAHESHFGRRRGGLALAEVRGADIGARVAGRIRKAEALRELAQRLRLLG